MNMKAARAENARNHLLRIARVLREETEGAAESFEAGALLLGALRGIAKATHAELSGAIQQMETGDSESPVPGV